MLACSFSSGGSAFICGEPVQIYLGDAKRQSPARCQILLRLPGQSGRQHEDHRPRCAAHLEDQQVWLSHQKYCGYCGQIKVL